MIQAIICFVLSAIITYYGVNAYFNKDNTKHEVKKILKVKNFGIVYDYEKGHVITAEISGKIQYLGRAGYTPCEAESYRDKMLIKARAAHKGFIDYVNTDYGNGLHRLYLPFIPKDYYDKKVYNDLKKKNRVINFPLHKEIMYDEYYYTHSITLASRYFDEELPKIEVLLQEMNMEDKYNIPLDDLLKLSIINDTEEERDFYFDQISLKIK